MADTTSPGGGLLAESQVPCHDVPPASTSQVHKLIHDVAEAHPEAEALSSSSCNLSYGQLDALSDRLAGYLVAKGVAPGVITPLLFEKSSWAVVSMLAVMKAGGAFLPLDISQPEARLLSIIRETGAKLALSSTLCYDACSRLVESTFAVTEQAIMELDKPDPFLPLDLASAAYVMATSGSTGTPKLVATEHSQLSSFVTYLSGPLGFTAKTRAFQFASYAFDPIIGDIFLTLAAGGTVCIPSEDERRNDIVGAMRRMRVTLAKFTPSLVRSLVDLTSVSVPTLKTLILGGETTPSDVIEAWAGKGDLKLVYGSTECTISCVVADAGTGAVVPGEIGRPVGSRAWVVKPTDVHELVSKGEVGELVIEGPLVSRGYLNNTAQTEVQFVKPPRWSSAMQNSTQIQHRMYRTGDLVRCLESGRLIYVGRVDNQVKIHGQRLELEEAEQHLHQALSILPDIDVKNILVDAAMPLGAATKELVGLLSIKSKKPIGSLLCDDDRGPTINLSPQTQQNFADLVSKLEAGMKLMAPSYMVPSLWIPIDEIPYTLSRKRDRQRLRKAIEKLPATWLTAFCRTDGRLSTTVEEGKAVMTEKESLLQRIWSDILGLEPATVHPDDNFFNLGGNSLLILKLVSMARLQGQVLAVDDVFQSPALRDLATKLKSAEKSVDLAPFALLEPSYRVIIQKEAAQQCGLSTDDIEDISPLSSMQHHHVNGYPELGRDIAGPWGWQQQIVFLLPDSFDISRFKSVWVAAVKRHSQLRTRVIRTRHGVFQVALRNNVAPAWRDDQDLDQYVRQDRSAVMSFGDELLRLAIAKSGHQSYFVFTIQHLIYDAYSRDMLFRELEAAFLHQSLPTDEPPRVSRFIQYINGADQGLAIDFWSSYLKGASTKALLSAPVGSPVGEVKSHSMTLERPKVPSKNYTLATIIELSGALAIAGALECSDVVFYSDSAGRNLPVAGIQDLMAPTTLLLPLRIHIARDQAVHDLLCSHQVTKTAMIPYEHLGWTELRKMNHLKDTLQHSLNMNINPYTPFSQLGANMGLKVVDDYEGCDDPFGINVAVGEDKLEWSIFFDENFISEATVRDLAVGIRESFLWVTKAYFDQQMSVGDILDHIRLKNGHCT